MDYQLLWVNKWDESKWMSMESIAVRVEIFETVMIVCLHNFWYVHEECISIKGIVCPSRMSFAWACLGTNVCLVWLYLRQRHVSGWHVDGKRLHFRKVSVIMVDFVRCFSRMFWKSRFFGLIHVANAHH